MAPAEIDVDVALVRALLAEQHPDLADLPVEIVAHGWDNVMARLGADLAVRVPRRALAAPLIEHEQQWLPVLAPRLQVPVPVPVRVGVPSRALGYPWGWSVVPWIAGLRGSDVPVDRRRPLAEPLADLYRTLHLPTPRDAPANPVRGVPLATRDGAVRDRVASGVVPGPERVLAVWSQAAAAAPWAGPALWIHGDPHPGNLVLAEDDSLRAVVDFGDLTAGDPATDLATAWLTFDAPGRRRFRERLGDLYPADDPVWLRARGWALSMATSMLTSGPEHAWVHAMGAEALDRVLDDS
ncbi:aminoglycoside phosphotransferase family protein [Isoptericola aurantiacus]|uniref:aminoglycoside phosphotransferase family protein n=1 Tax=Isoptericola aurantiacus TaxID=3377839 RepID=UPI00383AF3EE